MHKTGKVLVGISEAHSPADSRFEIACRTGKAECNHTLVLVPDVHHPVKTWFGALNPVLVEQIVPDRLKFGKCRIHGLWSRKAVYNGLCLGFVNNTRSLPLCILSILDITQNKDQFFGFTRAEGYFNAM